MQEGTANTHKYDTRCMSQDLEDRIAESVKHSDLHETTYETVRADYG